MTEQHNAWTRRSGKVFIQITSPYYSNVSRVLRANRLMIWLSPCNLARHTILNHADELYPFLSVGSANTFVSKNFAELPLWIAFYIFCVVRHLRRPREHIHVEKARSIINQSTKPSHQLVAGGFCNYSSQMFQSGLGIFLTARQYSQGLFYLLFCC